ncbi:kinase-like domain-containing protein [Phascolomyces articulosus]|uniref:Kinase-like domain-containing protein n=1 Tax=Phascolomyces articulosus TaxID=60185 RepID=A0AAD5K920_9FUNG|nr:kinase-like domain-containing protein [Phascolomyces articulosus]
MYTYPSKQQQYYTAALTGPGSADMPPSLRTTTSRHRGGSESLTPRTSLRSRKERQQQPQKQVRIDTEEEGWDSDSELDQAQVREARLVYRPIPSTSKSTPFYSTLVEPNLSLGEQWPKQSPRGFQKVLPGQKRKIRPTPTPSSNSSPSSASASDQNKMKPLYAMTIGIADTFRRYDPKYHFKGGETNPKRVLTKPDKPAMNDGYDNENCDYILRVNEILGEEKDYQYRVMDILGQGTFGQVVKCVRISTGQLYSVKVIKNKRAYRTQSRMEVEILKQLNNKLGSDEGDHVLQLEHTFNHKNHLCLVFELLSFNLYDLIKQNGFKGLSLNLVRVFALQLLDSLALLKKARIIHCDLKPENVLLKSVKSPTIKVIDFGSACHESSHVYTYIQSRFYRSPEILLGLPYNAAIDMWSLGCIVAELFIGIPLFPGSSEYNQLFRIVEMLGQPPQDMLDKGKSTDQFYNRETLPSGKHIYKMKSREQYGREQRKNELPGKRYLPQTELPALILEYTPKNSFSSRHSHHQQQQNNTNSAASILDEQERQRDLQMRHALINFLEGLLQLNPLKRWSPMEARYHPFITGEPYLEPYNPDIHMKNAMQSHKIVRAKPSPPQQQQQPQHPLDGVMEEDPSENTLRSLEAVASAVVSKRHSNRGATGSSTMPSNSTMASAATGPTRVRAQSLGIPTAPTQIQKLAQDMQAQPIDEQVQSTPNGGGRHVRPHNDNNNNTIPIRVAPRQHRHARSQGNLVGLMSPQGPIREQQQQQQIIDVIEAQQGGGGGSDSNSSLEKHTVYDGSTEVLPPDSTLRKVKIAPKVRVRYGSRDSFRMPDEVHGSKHNNNNSLQGNELLLLQQQPESSSSSSSHHLHHHSISAENTKDGWVMEQHQSSTTMVRPTTGRLAHAGEAAGGLLMMRQQEKGNTSHLSLPSAPFVSNGGKRVAQAIKRRTMMGGSTNM